MAVNQRIKLLKNLLNQEKQKTRAYKTELDFYKTTLVDTVSLVVITTLTGEITYCSPSFFTFASHSNADIQPCQEFALLPLWDKPQQIRQTIKKVIVDGVSTSILAIKNNSQIKLHTLASVLKDEKGNSQQLLFLMRVAEMKAQRKQDLQIKEKKFKSILNFAPVGVSWFPTDEQTPAFVNDLFWEVLGYSLQERTSVDLLELFPAHFFKHLLDQLSSAAVGKKHFMQAVEFKHRNGKPIFFNVLSDFVRINSRTYIFSFFRDVTEEKETNDLLIRKEESLRQAQRMAKTGNWEWDLRDNSRYYSDELFYIHEFTPTENFPYEPFMQLVHPDDRERVFTSIQDALKHFKNYDMEFRLLMPSGQIKHLHGVAQLFLDQEGKPEKMIGTIQDISERVYAQEALLKSERRLKRAQHIGKTGYWEWDILTNEVYWSDELYEMYELPIGTFIPTIQSVIDLMHESERKRITDYIYSTLQQKQKYYEVEGYVLTGNGQSKYFVSKAEILYDSAGNPVRMEGVSQDVTSIKKSEENLTYKEYLLENVNDAIFSTDRQILITSWNKAAERIYGWTSGEAIGKKLMALLNFEPPAVDSQNHRDFIEKGYWKGEHLLRRKDGTPITIQAHTILLRDSNQQVTGMVSVDRDVTEFQALQEKVSESEKMLQLVINSVPQTIFWKDIHSVYIGCNHNFARMASFSSADEVAGKTDFDMPWTREKAEEFVQLDTEILKEGKPRLNQIIRLKKQDGTLRWQHVNMVPLQDSSGNNIGILGTIDDITEKKIIEEQLNQKQANLEAIIENTDNLIWSVSKAYKVLAMNSKLAEFYRNYYGVILRVGDDYLQSLPAWLHERWIANHKKVLGGKKIIMTRRFIFHNTPLWFDIFCFPIVEADGNISGVAYMSRDVTKRIKNERLILKYTKQHNKLKLKQEKLKMLAILQGQEDERRKISMELHDGVGQLQTALLFKINKLSDKLYSFNNSEINNMASEITSLQKDIYQEVRRISEHLMPQYLNDFSLDKAIIQLLMLSFKNTQVNVESDIQPELVTLSKSLEVAIFRIIQEIINNVLKHANADQFYIKLYYSRQYLHLQVKDNGIGFDLSAQQTKRGKGLNHIKERINLLNGTITIAAQPGKGCAIEIKIPIF